MTIGEYRGTSVTSGPRTNRPDPRRLDTRELRSGTASKAANGKAYTTVPPPLQPASRSFGRNIPSQQPIRLSPPAPKASVNEESLFVGDDEEEERTWGEKNYDEDEGQLRWVSLFLVRAASCGLIQQAGFCRHKLPEKFDGTGVDTST